MNNNKRLRQIISKSLSSREPKLIHGNQRSYKHAGVLIPLFEDENVCKVLLTKRTNRVEHHKGQISFPGGSRDKEDISIIETVLREAHEEIGLLKGDVDILGRLDDTLTLVSNFLVHPFVGFINYPYDFLINEIEVKKLLKVPLSSFNYDRKTKSCGVEFEGDTYHTTAYEYCGELIWGATARIMENFMNIIGYKLILREKKK